MLRLIRLLMHVKRYRGFVATFLTLIPSLMPYLGIIFCVLCIYCSLGVQVSEKLIVYDYFLHTFIKDSCFVFYGDDPVLVLILSSINKIPIYLCICRFLGESLMLETLIWKPQTLLLMSILCLSRKPLIL